MGGPEKNNVIVFINSFKEQYLGGAEVFVFQIADILASLGYDIAFVSQKNSGFLTRAQDMSDLVVSVDFSSKNPQKLSADIATWIEHTFQHKNICLQGSDFYTDLIAAYVGGSRPWRVVSTEQRELIRAFTKTSGWLADRTKRFARKMVKRRVDAYLAVSYEIAEELERLKIDRRRIKVIAPPINIASLEMRKTFALPVPAFENLPKGKRIGFMGKFERVNQVNLLVDAFASLAENDPDVALLLAGQGSEQENLEAQIAALPEDVRARVGISTPLEAPTFMKEIDVYCSPVAEEGLSLAVLEAQALQVPVVATAVGGIKETVISRKTGIAVEPGSASQLAEALYIMLNNDAVRNACAKMAYEQAKFYYDISKVTDSLKEFYKDIFLNHLVSARSLTI